MSNKRQRQEFDDRKLLKHHGWQVSKADSVKFNGGSKSETVHHLICKTLVCQVLRDHKYRVSTEVVHENNRGEIDVVGYGKDDDPLAVEVETNISTETKRDKIDRYVKGTPIRDCFFIEVNDMPENIVEAKAFIEHELFGMSAE